VTVAATDRICRDDPCNSFSDGCTVYSGHTVLLVTGTSYTKGSVHININHVCEYKKSGIAFAAVNKRSSMAARIRGSFVVKLSLIALKFQQNAPFLIT